MHRPKDWKNPHLGFKHYHESPNKSAGEVAEIYEAGADAMLKALLADGFHIQVGEIFQVDGTPIKTTVNQTWVIIPDD